MNTVSSVDLTTAFKHCKVLIALVSDEFERDTTCRDMFLYAKETMNKEIITVVLGDSTEWMNKDLGMKIGNQERKLMAKTMQRYVVEGGRRDELKKWLEEKIMLSRMDEDSPPEVFLSYCWSNSHDAQEKSGKHLPGALGWADPRTLRSQLQDSGVNCWIDIEYVGREKKGIFRDMANGIRNSRVMLACVSDEYADSDNCMMELRFGILNLELPIVVAVVGQGSEWKETEVAMLLRRAKAPEVHLQKDNPEGCNILVKYLKDMIVSAELSKDKKPKRKDAKAKLLQDVKGEKKEEKSSSIAYQEEYELIQRKFMRHIITAISARDSNPLPRLIVVDFIKSASTTQGEDGRESSVRKNVSKSRKILRPKSATRSRDRLQVDESVFDDDVEDWSRESFCIKVLCENEEGWHLCEEKYPLAFRNHEQLESYLNKAAPYLYRIYSILRQSPIKLNCFTGGKNGKGEAYQAWIRSESESNLDFIGAMMHLRSELSSDEASQFVSCLERCRLPSGKIVWLCEKHQNLTHVAKLSTGSTGGSHNVQKVLFSEDKLLMENMEKSEQYKKLRSIKSSQVGSNLPAPVPIPQFTPKVVQTPTKPTDKTPSKPPTPKPPTPKPQPKEETTKTQEKEERPKSQAKDEPPNQQVERKPSVQNLQQDANKSKEKDLEDGLKQINTVKEEKDLESDMVNKHLPPNKQLLKTYSRSDVQQQIRNMVLNSDNNASLLKKKGRSLTKARSTANVYSTINQANKAEDTKPKNGFDRLQQQAIKSQKQSVTQPKIGQQNVPLDPKPPQSRIVKGSTIKRDIIKEDTGKSVPSKEDIQVNLRIKSSDSENSQSNTSVTKSEATSMTKSEASRMSVSKRQQPRQIKVKEYNNVTNNTAKGAGLTATGTTIGTSIGQPKGGEMPLPESNTSKACVIQ